MINVSHLTKKYNRFVANDNMSFMVKDGEIAVLAGPNGAGKSTAIKCIAGLLRFSGEIEICGHNNKSMEARQILGYVPEIPAPFELLTVWEHMEQPVAVEHIRAHAGMDIGDTLIGMHLREVAVPLRLSVKKIGMANLVCARTRPKFIGGERARYVEELK